MDILSLIHALEQKLIYLEYCLDPIETIPAYQLPRGVFRMTIRHDRVETMACFKEIQTDLERLKTEQPLMSWHMMQYLAHQIERKVRILSQCYALTRTAPSSRRSIQMKQLLTRHQWVDVLHQEKEKLLRQQAAFKNALHPTLEPQAREAIQSALSAIQTNLSTVEQNLIMTAYQNHHPVKV